MLCVVTQAAKWTTGGLALCLALLVSGVASAEQRSGAARVAVHAVGPLATPALERALRGWFSLGPYQLNFISEPRLEGQRLLNPPPDHLVHAWLSSESGFAYVRLARSDHVQPQRRYLLRRLRVAGELDLLALEQLSQMTHSAVEALLSQQIATPEQEFLQRLPDASVPSPVDAAAEPGPASAPTSAPVDAALQLPSRSRSAKRLLPRIALGFGGRARGPELLVYGPGISGALQWQVSGWALGPRACLSYLLPARTRHQELELTFRGQNASLAFALSDPSKLGWDVAVGAQLERTKLDVKSLQSELAAEAVPVDLRWYALLEAGTHLGLFGARLGVQAVLLVPLPASKYVLKDLASEREVFFPWRVQPGLLVDLGPLL